MSSSKTLSSPRHSSAHSPKKDITFADYVSTKTEVHIMGPGRMYIRIHSFRKNSPLLHNTALISANSLSVATVSSRWEKVLKSLWRRSKNWIVGFRSSSKNVLHLNFSSPQDNGPQTSGSSPGM